MEIVVERPITDNFVITQYNRLLTSPATNIRLYLHHDGYIPISSLSLLYLLRHTFGERFEVQISAGSKNANQLFHNLGFFSSNGEGERNLPLQRIVPTEGNNPFYGIIPTWIDRLQANLPAGEITQLGEIQTICFELINNVFDHSGSESGGVITSTYLQSKGVLQVAIADFGLTIPGTLGPVFSHMNLEEHEVIAHALEEKVSRRIGQHHNFGMGLNIIKRYALSDSECTLKILSGNGFLTINQKMIHCRRSEQFFKGTMVLMTLPHSFLQDHTQTADEDYAFDL